MSDLNALFEGMAGILQYKPLMLMIFGMAVSSVFAAVPGVGSLLFLSVMIPYAMTLSPYEAIALLLGIATVSNTSNTFSSVLIAVPGSAGSQATIVDGYPMAQKGEANRAFGAAFTASALGALFGAVVFAIALPVMRPLVLALGSPELLMLVVWGLSAVALLGGRAPIKGLFAAVLGLGVAMIGADLRTGIERFTFGSLYLIDGVSVIIIALGIFAIPELIALAARGTSISRKGELGGGLLQGVKDVFKNWWLVMRCSTIGVWVGAMPGLGSSVADWFAYAHAAQSCKNNETFGKGDVRGVIAPESSNNAKEGGALIPTTLFGIPGSTSFSLILFAFIAVGIQPGQAMVTRQLPYLYAMIATLVIANLMATTLALAASRYFAKVSLASPVIIFPLTIVLCFIGAFSVSYSINDLLTLVVFSTIGFFMKRFGWPRPPLLLAVVLGPQFETYLWITIDRYDMSWVARGGVQMVLGLIVVTIIMPMLLRYYKRLRSKTVEDTPLLRPRFGDNVMLLAIAGVLAFAIWTAQEWPARAALAVSTIATTGIVLAMAQFAVNLVRYAKTTPVAEREGEAEVGRAELSAVSWALGFLAMALLLGMHVATFLFPLTYFKAKGRSWLQGIMAGTAAIAFLFLLFQFLVRVVWPEPLLLRLVS
jgi:putative tricarboxylic transport membrane protein